MTAAQAAELKQTSQMKTIIERGASWTLDETKLLLRLWGQDQVARKDTPHKRTKEVYEKISEQFNQSGFERTPDQVRTRVFNMIAEYRRIIKDPCPEKKKKCVFFEAMHKIYKAQHWSEVQPLIDDNDGECPPCSPSSNSKLSETMDDSISDSEPGDGGNHDIHQSMDTSNSVSNNNNSTAATSSNSADKIYTTLGVPASTASSTTTTTSNNSISNNGNVGSGTNNKTSATSDNNVNNSINDNRSAGSSTSLGGVSNAAGAAGDIIAHNSINYNHAVSSNSGGIYKPGAPSNSNANNTSNENLSAKKTLPSKDFPPAIAAKRTKLEIPNTAAVTSHLLYQAPVNTFDVTSSALLIDRMFAHLSRESENMREWIALEKDRIALEKARRAQETEREIRRERVLIDTLMKFHEQWIAFVARLDPRLLEGSANQIPQLNIPPREHEATPQGSTSQTNQMSSASTTSSTIMTSANTTETQCACRCKGQVATATVPPTPASKTMVPPGGSTNSN